MGEKILLGCGIICLCLIIIALIWLPNAREKARRISCASNIHSLGLAFRMYSEDYNGYFPSLDGAAGLEMLRSLGYMENVKLFVCPSTDDHLIDNQQVIESGNSYLYFGGYEESDPGDTILMCDKENNHKDFRNILFLNGKVQGITEEEFKKLKK